MAKLKAFSEHQNSTVFWAGPSKCSLKYWPGSNARRNDIYWAEMMRRSIVSDDDPGQYQSDQVPGCIMSRHCLLVSAVIVSLTSLITGQDISIHESSSGSENIQQYQPSRHNVWNLISLMTFICAIYSSVLQAEKNSRVEGGSVVDTAFIWLWYQLSRSK